MVILLLKRVIWALMADVHFVKDGIKHWSKILKKFVTEVDKFSKCVRLIECSKDLASVVNG